MNRLEFITTEGIKKESIVKTDLPIINKACSRTNYIVHKGKFFITHKSGRVCRVYVNAHSPTNTNRIRLYTRPDICLIEMIPVQGMLNYITNYDMPFTNGLIVEVIGDLEVNIEYE